MAPRMTKGEQKKIKTLIKNGYSLTDIANLIGRSRSTVRILASTVEQDEDFVDSDIKAAMTEQDEDIVATDIKARTVEEDEDMESMETIWSRLRQFGIEQGYTYSYEEFQNMVLCYRQCSGKIKKARTLFEEKYGRVIPLIAIKEAVAAFDACDSLRTKSKSGSDDRGKIESADENPNDEDAVLRQEAVTDSRSNNEKKDKSVSAYNITDLVEKSLCVYTTRLDDMIIFKDLNKVPTQNILSSVIQESKPNKTKLGPIMESSGCRANYDLLVDKINQYNIMVGEKCKINTKKVETMCNIIPAYNLSENSLKLLKFCKDLSIPLNNCMESNMSTAHKITRNEMEPKILRNMYVVADSVDSTESPMIKAINLHGKSCLVIKNRYLNNTEVYSNNVSSGLPTEYYTVNGIIDYKQIRCAKQTTFYEFINCCWKQNENNIKYKFPTFFKNINSSLWYLRKPHSCTGKCSCCCEVSINKSRKRGRLPYPLKTVTLKQHFAQSNNLLDTEPVLHDFERHPDPLGYLTKVLRYCRRGKTNRAYDVVNQIGNNAFNMNIKMKGYTEHYSLGPKTSGERNISMSVCCWYDRQSKVSLFSPLIVNLVNEPHPCKTHKCKCCCKNKKSVPSSSLELQTFNLTQHYKSKHIPRWRSIEKFISLFNSDKRKQKIILGKTAVTKTINVDKETPKLPKPTTDFKKIRIINRNLLYPSQPAINSHPNNTNQITQAIPHVHNQKTIIHNEAPQLLNQPTNTNQIPIANPQINLPSLVQPNQKPEFLTPVDSPLITNVLKKYTDVHLTVDARGQVSANLSTPLHSMSTDNLKALATILRNAQQQVDAVVNQLKNLAENSESFITVPVLSLVPILSTIPSTVKKDIIDLQGKNFHQAYTLLTQLKSSQYRQSYRSHSNCLSNPVIPVIQSVTSLAPPKSPTTSLAPPKSPTPSTSGLKRTPKSPTPSTSGLKRTYKKQSKSKPEAHSVKRIRVKSPSKINVSQDPISNLSVSGEQNLLPATAETIPANSKNNQGYYQFKHTAGSTGPVPIIPVPALVPLSGQSEAALQNRNKHPINMLSNTTDSTFAFDSDPLDPLVEPKIEIEDDCVLGL